MNLLCLCPISIVSIKIKEKELNIRNFRGKKNQHELHVRTGGVLFLWLNYSKVIDYFPFTVNVQHHRIIGKKLIFGTL